MTIEKVIVGRRAGGRSRVRWRSRVAEELRGRSRAQGDSLHRSVDHRAPAPHPALISGSAKSLEICRADDGDRTRGPQLGKLMLYQLSYVRVPLRLARFEHRST